MGTSTPNFGLYKPEDDDNVIVLTDLSNNFDTIDTELDRQGDIVNPFGVGSGTWAVSWTARSGTAPSIGNGKLVGRYVKIGKYVFYTIYQKMGSTTTFGSIDHNGYQWSLPFASRNLDSELGSAGDRVWGGTAYAFDPGAANRVGLVNVASNSQVCTAVSAGTVGEGNAEIWSRTLPQTWADGDLLRLEGWYEAA